MRLVRAGFASLQHDVDRRRAVAAQKMKSPCLLPGVARRMDFAVIFGAAQPDSSLFECICA
jgi:hypothetical protein